MTLTPRIPGHRFLHSPGPTRVPDALFDRLLAGRPRKRRQHE